MNRPRSIINSERATQHSTISISDHYAIMFRSTISLLVVFLMTMALALPVTDEVIQPALIPAITPPFTQTCTTELPGGGTWILFTVNVGVIFANGAGCGGIYRTLVAQIGSSPEAFQACGLNTIVSD